MGEFSQEALRMLQLASTGGLVLGALIAGACAMVLAAAGGEQTRRTMIANAETARSGNAQVAALRRQATEAEERAAALGVRLAAIEAALGPRDVSRNAPTDGASDSVSDGARRDAPVLADGAEISRIAARLAAVEAAVRQPAALPGLPAEARALLAPERPAALPGETAERIADALRPLSGEVSVEIASAPGEGARLYAAQITGAIRAAGLSVEGPFGVLTTAPADGLFVSTGAAGEQILAALQGEGVSASPSPQVGPLTAVLTPDGRDVRIYVATAPTAPMASSVGG